MKRMLLAALLLFAGTVFAQQKPKMGEPSPIPAEDQAKLDAIKGKLKGIIIWSSSRANQHHDLWIMNADGTDPKPLTKGPKVDWYARISPDGSKVLFCRSKLDWTGEMDVQYPERWETWMINTDGTDEHLLVDKATWATWRPDGKQIVYARGSDVLTADADGKNEKCIVTGANIWEKGVTAQNPNMSDDGKFIGLTLRGSMRETGVLNMETMKWFMSGGGCQINFYPGTHRVFRINQTGNGGTEVFSIPLNEDGTHGEISGTNMKMADGSKQSIKLMDLPGKRSHEYFPKTDRKGEWMVWAATDRGHDHDIVDYDLFLWKTGTPVDEAVRLTHHTGNDRWPDIFLTE